MAAPKGHQFWKLQTKHGRDRIFTAPQVLWTSAAEYFEWCDANPWTVKKTRVKKGDKEVEEMPTKRPYTLSGLWNYLNVNKSVWYDLKKLNDKTFTEILTRIEQIIDTNQLEGAMVGAYNANIVARKLGLADKYEHTGNGGQPLNANITVTVVNSDYPLHESESEIDDV